MGGPRDGLRPRGRRACAAAAPAVTVRTHRLRDVGLITVVAAGTSLRLWGLGRNQLDFDETFTATAGRLPLGRLLTFLRYHDTHPPLDYLVRAPLARHGVSAFVFRMPSFLASVAALIVFACWMRRYGRLGLLATAALSVGSFQLAYGRDARAYAALEFVGVVGAWLADDWLRSPDRRRAVGAGGAALVGMLLHSGGLALAVGLVTVAGLRRDRQAWWWRGSLLVAGATWAALWGPSFATQVSRNANSWIPLASPHRVLVTFNELVNGYPALALVIVVLAAAGLVVLLRRQPLLARVLLCCSVVPIALISGLGFRAHVLLPRTLAPAAWGVLLALAALVDLAFDRWAPLGVAGLVLVAGLMLPSTSVILRPHPPGQEAAFRGYLEAGGGFEVFTAVRAVAVA